jgi:group I intron endonuclease
MKNNQNNTNLNVTSLLQGACTNLKPVVIYSNCLEDKNRILSDNKGKAAIYRWVNKINGKTYVGSSVNLTIRFYKYYSFTQLNSPTKRKTAIYNALLKYGFENFKLEILEYCVEGVNPVEREQYFLDLLKPEYNILNKAGSLLGFKHKAETLKFFKNERKVSDSTRENLSKVAVGRVLSPEHRKKLSEQKEGIKLSSITRAKISKAAVILRGVTISVKDLETSVTTEYASLTEAAIALGVSRTAVRKSVDLGRPIRNRYSIKLG